MTQNTTDTRTLHCECGNETYRIKWIITGTAEAEVWAECAECGRQTSAVGDPGTRFTANSEADR